MEDLYSACHLAIIAMLHYGLLGLTLGLTALGLMAWIGSGNPLWFVAPAIVLAALFIERPRV